MKDRLPTEFETKVIRRVQANYITAGDGLIAVSAACKRLGDLGYLVRAGSPYSRAHWYLTEKGEDYLDSLEKEYT